jgi:cytidine deaminase
MDSSRGTDSSVSLDSLTDTDEDLIQRAAETCEQAFNPDIFEGSHIVAAAVRTDNDETYTGVSLPSSIGRASVCAEPVAIGSAIADAHSAAELNTSVAVAYPMPYHDYDETRVIAPCGVCREMLADYRGDLRVIVPEADEGGPLGVARALDLLPRRTW